MGAGMNFFARFQDSLDCDNLVFGFMDIVSFFSNGQDTLLSGRDHDFAVTIYYILYIYI